MQLLMDAFKYKLQYYLTSHTVVQKRDCDLSFHMGMPEAQRIWKNFPQIVFWDMKSGPYSSKDRALNMMLLSLSGEDTAWNTEMNPVPASSS